MGTSVNAKVTQCSEPGWEAPAGKSGHPSQMTWHYTGCEFPHQFTVYCWESTHNYVSVHSVVTTEWIRSCVIKCCVCRSDCAACMWQSDSFSKLRRSSARVRR